MDELPPLDAFGTLVFQVAGQQLSVASTRAIISHLRDRFGGQMPSPAELLEADPQVLRDSGFSVRTGQTLRALAERFVDGRLSDKALAGMTDEEVEATLTEVPGIGLWTARGFLLVALDRPDVFLSGDLALRRAIQRAYGFDRPIRRAAVTARVERGASMEQSGRKRPRIGASIPLLEAAQPSRFRRLRLPAVAGTTKWPSPRGPSLQSSRASTRMSAISLGFSLSVK
jgi:3-methyladenine DNA glycosylase/8-oxoguanine DNA glycosylase